MADSVGSVSVSVVPDARGWAEKLRAQLRDVTVTVPVDADTTKAKAKLDELAAKSPTITVDVDDAAATTKLAAIEAQVDHLDGRTANVNVKTDKSSVGGAVSALEKFSGTLGALPALAVTAGAAMIPLGAAIGGVALALGAPLAIAGGGVGLFAVLGGLAVKGTEKQLKDIDKLRTHLGTLQKGTKEYAAAQKDLAAATAALSPAQRKLGDAQNTLSAAFAKLVGGKAGDALLAPIAQGMNVLAGILPRLTPLITAVSGALTTLLDDVAKATSGPGFGKFIGQLSQQVGPDIAAFGHIIGEVSKGIGGLLLLLGRSDLSGGLLRGLERMGAAFADWASSKQARDQVHAFLSYVQDVGPQVASVIGKIAGAFVKIGEALAPLAPGVLKALGGAADAISAIPVPVLTSLATAVVALTAFNKLGGFKATGAIGAGVAKTGGCGRSDHRPLGGGVQKVFVVNMPGEGIPARRAPRSPPAWAHQGRGRQGCRAGSQWRSGAPGGVQGAAPSRHRSTGEQDPGALGAAGFAAIGVPTVDPKIAVAQGKLWDQVFTGHFSAALDMLKAPGPLADPNAGRFSPAKAFRGTTQSTGKPGGLLAGYNPFPAVPGEVTRSIQSTTTAVDGLKGASAQASHQIDQLGPQAQQSSAQAVGAFHRAQAALDAIHDKRIAIIVDTQGLINKLQAINDFHIADKSFTVNVTTQHMDRLAGPGGGMGRHAAGGWVNGPGTGTSDSVPSLLSAGEFVVGAAVAHQNRAELMAMNSGRSVGGNRPVHVTVVGHVDEDGYITGTSQDVYAANNDFERAHG